MSNVLNFDITCRDPSEILLWPTSWQTLE